MEYLDLTALPNIKFFTTFSKTSFAIFEIVD